jgi:hypothetical protein
MITASDLVKKLRVYALKNPHDEVYLEYDGGVAFPLGLADEHTAMGSGGLRRFLVFKPDLKDTKLVLKGME